MTRAFFAFVTTLLPIFVGCPAPPGTCSKNSDCAVGELCFPQPDGSLQCKNATGEGEGEGSLGEGEGSSGEGEGEGAPAAVTLTANGPVEANTELDTTIAWTIENASPSDCTLTANGIDAGFDLSAANQSVALTTSTVFVVTCGTATASLTTTVHSIGAIQGPDAVLRGDVATFTVAVNDASNCFSRRDSQPAVALVVSGGTGEFTDTVDADAQYTVTCDGVGQGDLVQTKSVTAIFVDVTSISPIVVDAGSDVTITIDATLAATCVVSSTAPDGSDPRAETATESDNGTERTFDITGLLDVRTLHVTCALDGVAADATVDTVVRPSVTSMTGDFTSDTPPKLAITWSVVAQDAGACTFSDGALTETAPTTGITIPSGSGVITYTLQCGFDSTDASPSTATVVVFWGAVGSLSQLNQLTAQSVSVVIGSVDVAFGAGSISTGSIRAISGGLSVGDAGGSGGELDALNLVDLGGDLNADTNQKLTAIQAPKMTSVGNITIFVCNALHTISLPQLQSARSVQIEGNNALTSCDFNALASITDGVEFDQNQVIGALFLPALTSLGGNLDVDLNPDLATLDLSSLVDIGASVDISGNFLSVISAGALTGVHGTGFVIQNNEPLDCSQIQAMYCPLNVRPAPTVSNNASASCSGVNTGC